MTLESKIGEIRKTFKEPIMTRGRYQRIQIQFNNLAIISPLDYLVVGAMANYDYGPDFESHSQFY